MHSLTTTHIVLLGLALHSAALPLTYERRNDPLVDASGIEDLSKRVFCQGALDCLQGSEQSNTAPPQGGAAQGPVNQQPAPIQGLPTTNQGPPAQGQGQGNNNVRPGRPKPQRGWTAPALDPYPQPVVPPTALRPPPRRHNTVMTPATSPATEGAAQSKPPKGHKPSESIGATFGVGLNRPSSSSQGEGSSSASGSASATRSGNRSSGGASRSLGGLQKAGVFKGKINAKQDNKKLSPGSSAKLTKGAKARTQPKGKTTSTAVKTNRNGARKSTAGSAKQKQKQIAKLTKSRAKANAKAPKAQAPKTLRAGKKGARQGVRNLKANVARKPNRPAAQRQPPSEKPVAKSSVAVGKKAVPRKTK